MSNVVARKRDGAVGEIVEVVGADQLRVYWLSSRQTSWITQRGTRPPTQEELRLSGVTEGGD